MHRIKKHIGTHHISTKKSFLAFFLIIFLGTLGVVFSLGAYAEIFQTQTFLGQTFGVRPYDKLEINFSLPMETYSYAEKIQIVPTEKISWQWENSNKKLVISPKGFWKPGENYKIILPKGKNAMFVETAGKELNFTTEKYPQVLEVSPQDGAREVVLGAEEPIIVNFEKSTQDFFLKFVLNSQSDLFVQNNVVKTQFKILPKEEIISGQKYSFTVYAKYLYASDESYQKIYESSFETLPAQPVAWDKDYTVRLAQAKKYTRPKIMQGKYIDINLEAQILSLFEDGKLLDNYMVSTGKSGMETPKGKTQIYNKAPRAYSREYGLYMPYWMALAASGKFGIHELPEWPSGYKEGATHLGIPVSHGCVRLGVGPAERAYNWAQIGTPVVIY